jgi:hypothetical protein
MTRTTRIEAAISDGNKVTLNGKDTYFITNIHGDCYGYYDTDRKAQNAMAQIGKGLVG